MTVERLDLEVGCLRIRQESDPNGPFGVRTTIEIDGQPVPVREITIHGEIGKPWTAEITMVLVRGPKP